MDEPIYIDPGQPAFLSYDVHVVNCHSLQEAKDAFDNLLPDQKEIAAITIAGRTYRASEIERFCFGPKPA